MKRANHLFEAILERENAAFFHILGGGVTGNWPRAVKPCARTGAVATYSEGLPERNPCGVPEFPCPVHAARENVLSGLIGLRLRYSSSRNFCHGSARTPGETAWVGVPDRWGWWTRNMLTAVAFPRFRFSASASRFSGAATSGVAVRPDLHSTSATAPPRPGMRKSTSKPCSSRK